MSITLPIKVETNIKILDKNTREILHEGHNAIHSQNVARIFSRALSHETNSWIYRMAFGNGGTFIDAAGNVVHNIPNDGADGSWESRLYNETYSEVVDETNPNFGQDLGSSDSNVTRPGGGAEPSDDPVGGGVVSQEAGLKSNVIITVFLNENEPAGEALVSTLPPTQDQQCFLFDEIGLYSPGKPAKATNGITTINVGNKNSEDTLPLAVNTTYNFRVTANGTLYTCQVRTSASGSGPNGELTYGDFCEGINNGSWITSGDPINNYVYVYITDNSGGTYPSIIGKQSYGYVIFQSKTSGANSSVILGCSNNTPTDLMNALTGNSCANCNVTTINGLNAGVQNDPITPANERERLLTHFIFDPILKSADRAIEIQYTLTISVARSADSMVEVLKS